MTDKIGLTIEEAADYTGIGRNTMRKLVEWEKIPVLRIGRRYIIRIDVIGSQPGCRSSGAGTGPCGQMKDRTVRSFLFAGSCEVCYNSRPHIITAPFAAMRGEALWQKVL